MTEKLIALIEQETKVRPVTSEMSFEDLGMDSLDFMELIQQIREKVGPITRQQAQGCTKVADLMAVFA